MNKLIDLHVHSNCSDGTFSPEELVDYALEKGLSAFALTDHDTVAGITPSLTAASGTLLEVIPGIELSTHYQGRDIHILGLGIDIDNTHFQEELSSFQNSREYRNTQIIERLNERSVNISLEQMSDHFPESVWTRAHFACYLRNEGYVASMNEAFVRYIGDNAPCYVPRKKVTPQYAIELIHSCGGYASLAHPLLYHLSKDGLDTLAGHLAAAGIDALEAIYSTNRWTDESDLRRLARKYSLKITGGSDFHGANKPDIDLGVGRGNLAIPYELWEQLCQ